MSGRFLKNLPVDDKWLGPGKADGRIDPVSYSEDGVHFEDSSARNYFELWYFDAHLEGGYVFVGFLHASEPMTHKPFVEIHIYHPDGHKVSEQKHYGLKDVKAESNMCDVRIGENRAYMENLKENGMADYRVSISEGSLSADLKFSGEVPPWRPGKGRTYYGEKGFFAWIVAMPKASVEGTVTIDGKEMKVRGRGYHDHNWGTVDVKMIVRYWYWGRIYSDDFTLLYAFIRAGKRYGYAASKPLMLAKERDIILSSGEMELMDSDFRFNAAANRDYPQKLNIEIPDRLSLALEVKSVIDTHDFLGEYNKALRWMINRFIGRPGYFRFDSEFELKIDFNDIDYRSTGKTLNEMVALR